ncbi:CD109 antigen [Meloidogyne graminicola]|uniref:CD109 antigen n=1 Tax=Meloidogyne graminicola TaxID=189291 RepID=A0A8S9ZYQ5_9BILA|nr:CD109 antigen [Meloidogyne graminicola]
MDYGGSTLKIIAQVIEELTEQIRNNTAQLTIYEYDVKLELEKQGETFKPGLTYSVFVALKQMDDSPIKSSLPRRVHLTIFYFFNFGHTQEEKEIKILELDAHGTANMQLLPPLNCSNFRVEASYDRSGHDNFTDSPIYSSLYVEAARSPSQSFLQVNADNQGIIDSGKTLSFSVKCTEHLTSLIYQVVARGIVILSEQINFSSEGQTNSIINFEATPQMSPKARLVVYSIRSKNKEIVVDAVDFRVEGIFKNNVTLTSSVNQAIPGEQIKITVHASPDSFIGLLAIDQSVLLLKSGNDLTKELIEQDLEEYDTTSGGNRFWGDFRMKRRSTRSIWYPWWGVGGRDASSIFKNSGLVVLTDAFLYSEPEPMALTLKLFNKLLKIKCFYFFALFILFVLHLLLQHKQGKTFQKHGFGQKMILLQVSLFASFAMPLYGSPHPRWKKMNFRSFKFNKSAGLPLEQNKRIRTEFPETWIWTNTNFTTNENGEAVYEAIVPDTITSWVASAFAINEQTGLGLAPSQLKLRVFRPFFLRLELPYSVKRGEKMALQVLIFNYLDTEQEVTVTLKPNPGFELIQKDGLRPPRQGNNKRNIALYSRSISVPGGGVTKAVYFPLKFTEIGHVRISLQGKTEQESDAIEHTLLVEPEGYKINKNVPLIIDLSQPIKTTTTEINNNNNEEEDIQLNELKQKSQQQLPQFHQIIEMQFPADYVPGSRKAHFEVIGDIMGPVLANLDSLVRMPYGCGEQNMVTLVPNIVVLRYLLATHRSSPQIELKIKKYIETGYQRELTYRHSDNSFSAFGEHDPHGSTWLTAFVINSFKQAQSFIYIDEKILEDSIAF